MQLAIVSNPHLDPKDQESLWNDLKEDDSLDYIEEETLDKTAFLMLKQQMSTAPNSKMIVK